MITPDNTLTKMQHDYYRNESAKWSVDNRDPVVGSFDQHNEWEDWDLLFDGIDTSGTIGLDFGCGPGRCLVKYGPRFKRLDGVDMDIRNLTNAGRWCSHNGIKIPGRLIKCNGVDLSAIPDDEYDLIMSSIVLSHIPVYSIRQNYFREFVRVLKPGGVLTAQMGFGAREDCADYYEDQWDAPSTNGHCDVATTEVSMISESMTLAGFDSDTFRYQLRPPGPGCAHPQWIFFQGRTPQ